MKKPLLILALAMLFVSCPKDPLCPPLRHELRISFYNTGFDRLEVTLFPRQEYWGSDSTLYRMSSTGGGYLPTEFTLLQGGWSSGEVLYYSDDTVIAPSALLTQVFDSILVRYSAIFYDTSIFFSPEKVINYESNPFINDSAWLYEVFTTNHQDMNCRNEVRVKDYSFSIGN